MRSYKNKRFIFYNEVPLAIRKHVYGLAITPPPQDLQQIKILNACLAYWDRNLPIKMTDEDFTRSESEDYTMVFRNKQKQIRRPLGFRPKGDIFKAKRDRSSFWMMYPEEIRSCCIGLATPKYNRPIEKGIRPNYDLLRHCLSIRHIANLYDVSFKDLHKAVSPFFIEDGKCGQCRNDYVARNDYICLDCTDKES